MSFSFTPTFLTLMLLGCFMASNYGANQLTRERSQTWQSTKGVVNRRVSTIVNGNKRHRHMVTNQQTGDHAISAMGSSSELQALASAKCKVHCLEECVEKLEKSARLDPTLDEVVKKLNVMPTRLRKECMRLSPGLLFYDACDQACDSGQLFSDCSRMCENGDSPDGWSCLTGCRLLDSALRQRSGECPPLETPSIHTLPHLTGGNSTSRLQGRTTSTIVGNKQDQQECSLDVECPARKDKCCYSRCKPALFRSDLFESTPPLRIVELKSPPSFSLTWDLDPKAKDAGNNVSSPIVYVLQVKTYFGPQFDAQKAGPWKTLLTTTMPGASLSEPGIGWWYQFQLALVNRWGSLGFENRSPPCQLTNQRPRPPSRPRHLRQGVLTLHADRNQVDASISWQPPIQLSSIPLSGYQIVWILDQFDSNPLATWRVKKSSEIVPPTQTEFQLTNLEPNQLYKIQVIALSKWGQHSLTSQPTTTFLRTPVLPQHDLPLLREAVKGEEGEVGSLDGSFGDKVASQLSMDIERKNYYDLLSTSSTRKIEEKISAESACICDGNGKYELIARSKMSSSARLGEGHLSASSLLDFRMQPFVLTNHGLTAKVELEELLTHPTDSNPFIGHLPHRMIKLTWTPQACIESLTSSQSQPKSASDHITLRPISDQQLTLNRTSRLRSASFRIKRLFANCRYLLNVYNAVADDNTSQQRIANRHDNLPILTSCFCTPSCQQNQSPGAVSKSSCPSPTGDTTTSSGRLPGPVRLKHSFIESPSSGNNYPLAVNLSWQHGQHRPLGSHGSTNRHDNWNQLQYRVIWGPSRDSQVNSLLWQAWPALRPRIDSMLAETKVLKQGQTSLLLNYLKPNTQYVVKLQSLAVDRFQTGDQRLSSGQDRVQRSRSIEQRQSMLVDDDVDVPSLLSGQDNLLTSREVDFYFVTPPNNRRALSGHHPSGGFGRHQHKLSTGGWKVKFASDTILSSLFVVVITLKFLLQ